MAAFQNIFFLLFLVGCIAVARPSKIRADPEDIISSSPNEVAAEDPLDDGAREVAKDEVEAIADEDDDDDDTDEIARKLAEFINGYKKTMGEINAGIEVINGHIEKASKKIGEEIKQTFARIRAQREEL